MKRKKQERRVQKNKIKSKGTSGRKKKLNSRTLNARDGTRDEYGFW